MVFIGGLTSNPQTMDIDSSKAIDVIDLKYPTDVKRLAVLPDDCANMASVCHGNKIFVSGGRNAGRIVLLAWDTKETAFNSFLMLNPNTGELKTLPNM